MIHDKILTLGDLKHALVKHLQHGYHIDFDSDGNTIVMVHRDEVATARYFLYRDMPDQVAKHVKIVKIGFFAALGRKFTRWVHCE